LLHPASNWLTH